MSDWIGMPLGISDREGNPVHVGDTLRFDEREWGEPYRFTLNFARGEVDYPGGGAVSISEWCTIIKKWDEDAKVSSASDLTPERVREMLEAANASHSRLVAHYFARTEKERRAVRVRASIPARPDHDDDLVVSRALRGLAREVLRLRELLETCGIADKGDPHATL